MAFFGRTWHNGENSAGPLGKIAARRIDRMPTRNESQRMSGFRCRTKRGAGQVVRRSPKKAPNQMASRRESVHFPQRAYSLAKATRRTQWRCCDAAMTLRQKNNRPLPQSAREVGQANRKIMTTEAKQRRVRRKFTARPSVQHASCRAGTAAFRASGSKGNKTTRAQQPLLLKLG